MGAGHVYDQTVVGGQRRSGAQLCGARLQKRETVQTHHPHSAGVVSVRAQKEETKKEGRPSSTDDHLGSGPILREDQVPVLCKLPRPEEDCVLIISGWLTAITCSFPSYILLTYYLVLIAVLYLLFTRAF